MWLFYEKAMVAVNTDRCVAISYDADNQSIKFELGAEEFVEWEDCSLQLYTKVLQQVGCNELER